MFQKPDSMETDKFTVLSQIPFNSRWPMRSWKYKKKRKRNVAMSEAAKWPGRDLESWPLARYLCPHLLGSKASVWQPEYANW